MKRSARLLALLASPALLLAGPVALAGTVTVPAAAAASCQSWVGGQPPSPGSGTNNLEGVTVLSQCDMWTVGFTRDPVRTLIEHWDGADWTVVPSPSPGQGANGARLFGVRAVSATSIWAVGNYATVTGREKTLILHWDGTKWAQVASPSPGSGAELSSVRVISASDAWAVGDYSDSSGIKTLTLHWNGTAWVRIGSPNFGPNSELNSVAATSHSDVWAVGADFGGVAIRPLGGPRLPSHQRAKRANGKETPIILHWNGSKWAHVPSPAPGQFGSVLEGVSATSAASAWAVGVIQGAETQRTFILRWDGTRWTQVTSPNVGGTGVSTALLGVVATSGGTAFAVGDTFTNTAGQTFVARWDGTSWKQIPSPNPGAGGELIGVGATSATNVWAVGSYLTPDGGGTLALAVHCC